MFKSFLDDDLYKFTMQQAIAQHYPSAEAEYSLIVRSQVKWPGIFDDISAEIKRAFVNTMPMLTDHERNYLREKCPFLTPFYLDFLSGYKYDFSEIKNCWLAEDGHLEIRVAGPWYRTVLWEVKLLALISELYHRNTTGTISPDDWKETANRVKEKSILLNAHAISHLEGGTRRRHSFNVQNMIIEYLAKSQYFIGTSNVSLAMQNNVKPIGTQAHEWLMFHGAVFGYQKANTLAMDKWIATYGGRLGIALADTYTTNVFLSEFGPKYARLFDGVRQDSGDPLEFAENVIKHYEKLGIDPKSKTIIFSDGLDVEKVLNIRKFLRNRIKSSFLIGTNLACDVPEVKPLNMVIKMTKCRLNPDQPWKNTVKLSDFTTKNTGNAKEIELCKATLGIA